MKSSSQEGGINVILGGNEMILPPPKGGILDTFRVFSFNVIQKSRLFKA